MRERTRIPAGQGPGGRVVRTWRGPPRLRHFLNDSRHRSRTTPHHRTGTPADRPSGHMRSLGLPPSCPVIWLTGSPWSATGPARSAVDPEGGLGMTAAAEPLHTPGENTRDDWKNTILAGLANYIDAGSIVSGAVALGLWAEEFNLSTGFLGVLGAFSANAISAGVGALIGGRRGDPLGGQKDFPGGMLDLRVRQALLGV